MRFPLTKTTRTAAYLLCVSKTNSKTLDHRIVIWSLKGITDAAVAPKTSAIDPFVNKPTLAAKMTVNKAISPKRRSLLSTLYRISIAPTSRSVAKMVLRYDINAAILSPEA